MKINQYKALTIGSVIICGIVMIYESINHILTMGSIISAFILGIIIAVDFYYEFVKRTSMELKMYKNSVKMLSQNIKKEIKDVRSK